MSQHLQSFHSYFFWTSISYAMRKFYWLINIFLHLSSFRSCAHAQFPFYAFVLCFQRKMELKLQLASLHVYLCVCVYTYNIYIYIVYIVIYLYTCYICVIAGLSEIQIPVFKCLGSRYYLNGSSVLVKSKPSLCLTNCCLRSSLYWYLIFPASMYLLLWPLIYV